MNLASLGLLKPDIPLQDFSQFLLDFQSPENGTANNVLYSWRSGLNFICYLGALSFTPELYNRR